ncbi:hypothetical protein NQ176_g2189 [Zarea fungicola]|uniref:Uncharacterized protein n=1 Tax=Zarea fungicola TaxID=93591 RepID=A0ACC1NQU3_9HYPO|nr:hypothetical protein NQ176_g2189 [Lecanicillium fungicola]
MSTSVDNEPSAFESSVPDGVDTQRPSVARMYDVYLGGTHNFSSDREAVEAVKAALPDIIEIAVEGRAFLGRVIRFMCSQGVTQFIDIGSGLPSSENTHQVAQKYQAHARVVYVDIDPIAVAHGKSILGDNPDTAFIYGSALEVKKILDDDQTKRLIDFSKPVGIVMMGLVHFFSVEQSRDLLAQLKQCLAPGSLLGLTHGTTDGRSQEAIDQTHAAYAKSPTKLILRPKHSVEEILEGYTKVAPGLVMVDDWRMELAEEGRPLPPSTRIWYGFVLQL